MQNNLCTTHFKVQIGIEAKIRTTKRFTREERMFDRLAISAGVLDAGLGCAAIIERFVSVALPHAYKFTDTK